MPRAKRNLTEELSALQAFKDGVLELVQKHFGRKTRKIAVKPQRKNGPDRTLYTGDGIDA